MLPFNIPRFFVILPDHGFTDILIFILECVLGEGAQKSRWPPGAKRLRPTTIDG